MSFWNKLFGGSDTPIPSQSSQNSKVRPVEDKEPTPSQSNTSEWKALSKSFNEASEDGDLEKVSAMLKDNPNLVFSRIVHFGNTPLHAAAFNGQKHIVELLLAKGVDVNVKNQNDSTPLHNAADDGHTDVVELLLAKGADVNAKSNYDLTPLHMATKSNKQVVELLLANGANVNAKDEGGRTPLSLAIRKGNNDVAELLRQHGGKE